MLGDINTVLWHDILPSISGCTGNSLSIMGYKINPIRLPVVLCSIHYRLVLLLYFKHQVKACIVESVYLMSNKISSLLSLCSCMKTHSCFCLHSDVNFAFDKHAKRDTFLNI